MRIRAILFDKDGTLLDFHATWAAFARELAAEASGGDEAEAARLLARAGYNLHTARFEADSVLAAGTNAEVIASMFPRLRGPALQRKIADSDRRAAELATSRAVPLSGVIEALSLLRAEGYRLGLATNDSTAGAEGTLVAFGIAHLFEAAYGYDAVINPKPAPDVLLAFAQALGVAPGEIAMVGDNTHDIVTARRAGAGLAIGVLSGTGRRDDLERIADVVLPSVSDLPAWLATRGAPATVIP